MTSLVINAAIFVALGCVAVLIATVLWKSIVNGPGEVRKARRMGWGIQAWWNANLEKQNPGSTIDVIEGLELMADGDRIESVRPTRTMSGEIA